MVFKGLVVFALCGVSLKFAICFDFISQSKSSEYMSFIACKLNSLVVNAFIGKGGERTSLLTKPSYFQC